MDQNLPADRNVFQAAPVQSETVDAYYAAVDSFEKDRLTAAQATARTLKKALVGAGGVIACMGVAIAAMMPLHTIEDRLWLVDKTTGAVDQISSIGANGPHTFADATTTHFIDQYIRVCQGYIWQEVSQDFHACELMSSAPVQASYVQDTRAANPRAPVNVYGRKQTVDTKIISLQPRGRTVDTAGKQTDIFVYQADYWLLTRDNENPNTPVAQRRYTATIDFIWRPEKMAASDRPINPLGFLAISWHSQDVGGVVK